MACALAASTICNLRFRIVFANVITWSYVVAVSSPNVFLNACRRDSPSGQAEKILQTVSLRLGGSRNRIGRLASAAGLSVGGDSSMPSLFASVQKEQKVRKRSSNAPTGSSSAGSSDATGNFGETDPLRRQAIRAVMRRVGLMVIDALASSGASGERGTQNWDLSPDFWQELAAIKLLLALVRCDLLDKHQLVKAVDTVIAPEVRSPGRGLSSLVRLIFLCLAVRACRDGQKSRNASTKNASSSSTGVSGVKASQTSDPRATNSSPSDITRACL